MKRVPAWARSWSGASVAALYVVVVVWVFIGFPTVNLSSGELKPRGLFVDENAFNLHNDVAQHLERRHLLTAENDSVVGGIKGSGCSALLRLVSSDVMLRCHATDDGLATVTVHPRYSPLPLESTLLVLQVPLSVAVSLIDVLGKAKWMARNVVLLLPIAPPPVPPISPEALQTWLRSEHYQSAGLIRQGFVVQCPHRRFHQLLLSYTSPTGVLPNMDMVSFALRLYSPMVTSLPLSIRTHSFCTEGFRLRLCGLLYSLGQQLAPALFARESALPALLNEINIDSIGLVSADRADGLPRASYGETDLLRLLVGMVFQGNTLEEELHHSFFFYLLMGDQHFVGLPEYGLTIAVMLVSLAGLVVQTTDPMNVAHPSPWLAKVHEACVLCSCACAMLDLYPKSLPALAMRERRAFRMAAVVLQLAALVCAWKGAPCTRALQRAVRVLCLLGLAVLASWSFAQALTVYVASLPLALLGGLLPRRQGEAGMSRGGLQAWIQMGLALVALGVSVGMSALGQDLTTSWPIAVTGGAYLRMAQYLL